MTAPTEPGLYPDLPEAVYHGDLGSLSSSGARRLLEVAPAQWKWERDHPDGKSADHFDLGTAVHTLVLGTGDEFADAGHPNWTTKAAKEARDAIRAGGRIPLRSQDFELAHAMADAVRKHPTVVAAMAEGQPELSVYYRDEPTGVLLRARPDWLRPVDEHTAVVVDLKTSSTAPTPADFATAIAKHGYDSQYAWYRDALAAHGIDIAWVFVVVSTAAPHLVYAADIPEAAYQRGAARNRRAIDIYARCLETGVWPDHGGDIHHIDLPAWAYKQELYS